MAAIDTTRTHHTNGIANPVGRIFAAVAAWYDARSTRNALSKLSDRELEDIGLSRCDIELIARRA